MAVTLTHLEMLTQVATTKGFKLVDVFRAKDTYYGRPTYAAVYKNRSKWVTLFFDKTEMAAEYERTRMAASFDTSVSEQEKRKWVKANQYEPPAAT